MNGPTTAEAVRETQVSREVGLLNSEIERLEADVSRLLGGLAPVLRTPDPSAGEDQKMPAESLVPLADTLRSFRERIDHVRETAADAYQRLEL